MAQLTINNAADSGLFVVESIRQYKDVVHESITRQWLAKRPGDTPPDFAAQLAFMADDLDDSRVEMIKSMEVYLNTSTVDPGFTRERDAAVSDMRTWYQFGRDLCLKYCGESRTLKAGFDTVTEQHPWRLERQSQRAINAFKELDPDAQVEVDHPAKLEGAPRNGFIVSVLEPPHEVLSEVLGVWISQRRGTEKALIRKDAALEAYQRKFSIYARNAETLYRWAGLDEEARRIKPSTRRPGQRAVVADTGSESSDPSAPDGAAPDGAGEGNASSAPGTANP